MSLRELMNECIFDLAREWRLAWHGLSLYTQAVLHHESIPTEAVPANSTLQRKCARAHKVGDTK